MPVAYILGYKYFWKSKFFINDSVLVPRAETELIVEEALKYLPKKKSKKVIDIEMNKKIALQKPTSSTVKSDEVIRGKVSTQKDKLKQLRRG